MDEVKNIQETTKKAWSIAKVIGRFSLYFKVVVLGKTQIEGYKYREVGNLPIVGVHHYEGYEIINLKTNKVLYRWVKDWGIIGDATWNYNPNVYDVVKKYFPENALL